MVYDFSEGQFNPPAPLEVVQGLSNSMAVDLPKDYLEFLVRHNGGEGFVGKKYVIFWKAEELSVFNREYEVEKYAPGILLFGSSGGGEGYGYDTQSMQMPIVRIPFIGMDRKYAKPVAKDLRGLFANLAEMQ